LVVALVVVVVHEILSWHHTGFNVHSKVRATTKQDARRVARYMAKPILALGRLSFDHDQGKVIYKYGDGDTECVQMDYLDFIARITTHIPDKGQATSALPIITPPPARRASPGWRELIRKVHSRPIRSRAP
jgi:hypothetical protein